MSMTSDIRRLPYRAVQRLNDDDLSRRLENVRRIRESRFLEIERAEREYLERFVERREQRESVVADIDIDSGLSQLDRDLLVNEIYALDVFRKRRERRERQERLESVVSGRLLSPREVHEMGSDDLLILGLELKNEHDSLRSAHLGTFSPNYIEEKRNGLDRLEYPVWFYVNRGISDEALAGLSFLSHNYTLAEDAHVRNRITWLREAKGRGLA